MANIIGDWLTAEMITYVEGEGLVFKSREYFEQQADVDNLKIFSITARFLEDGNCIHLMPLPDGFTPKMVAEEGMEMVDGMVIIDSKEWKEENGKLWIDSGEYREAFGEQLSSFDEMVIEGDTITLPSIKLIRK